MVFYSWVIKIQFILAKGWCTNIRTYWWDIKLWRDMQFDIFSCLRRESYSRCVHHYYHRMFSSAFGMCKARSLTFLCWETTPYVYKIGLPVKKKTTEKLEKVKIAIGLRPICKNKFNVAHHSVIKLIILQYQLFQAHLQFVK